MSLVTKRRHRPLTTGLATLGVMSSPESHEDKEVTIALTPIQLGMVATILILVIVLRRRCKTS